MATAPRIVLLVHNRLEDDPRVSRHAHAALAAGYRVAVCSVVQAGQTPAPRWGEAAQGIQVYESRVIGQSLLGRLRRGLGRLPASRRPIDRNGVEAGGEPGGSADAAPRDASDPRRAVVQSFTDMLQIALLLRNNFGVYRQFRGIGGALVHANDLNVLPAGYLLARACRAPLLYDSHELWTQLDEGWSPLRRALYGAIERVLIRRAAAVVTVNGAIADRLADLYGIPRPAVVMNCPEAPSGAPIEPDGTRQGPGLAVIYQGMLNANRGLAELIDAAGRVESVRLDIRGPGALRDELQARIEQHGLGARVRVLQPVPMHDLVAALDGYQVGVVPYLPVGMNNLLCSPNKLFEYMAAGVAVLCSDLPVLRQIVEAAECGLLFEAGNVESQAAALRRLATDAALLDRLRANARRAALDRYNAAHEEGILIALYGTLLGARGSGRRRQAGEGIR